MSDNKYYVPDISEFRVGFEFEEMNDIFEKEVFGETVYADYDLMKDLILEGDVRVKHLDRDDIEELGFKSENWSLGQRTWMWFKKDQPDTEEGVKRFPVYILYDFRDISFISVFRCQNPKELFKTDNYHRRLIDLDDIRSKFTGKIRNKSELKLVLDLVLT